jgi:lysozyme
MVPGIDVSNHQATINWPAVSAAGYRFAFCKATEGTTFRDAYFTTNFAGLKAAGMRRGAYHYASPDDNAPEAEADFFVSVVAPQLDVGDLVALDMEDGTGNLLDWTLRWLRRVESRLGWKPLIYSGHWFLQPHGLEGSAELSEYGLWLASWTPTMPTPPPNWFALAFWQKSASATVPGVTGVCDLTDFNGTEDRLPMYGKPASVPAPAPDWRAVVADAADKLDATSAELRALLTTQKGKT